jgi:hypothetical protein
MKNNTLSYFIALLLTGAFAQANSHAEAKGSCADGLLGHYFESQQALAADDLEATQTAAKALMADYKQSSCSEGDKACCLAVGDSTQAIIEAASIADARKAFKTLSDTIIPLVKENGLGVGDAHLAFCPMAFGNTGASWLQKDKAISNPYFGSEMFSCGVVKQTFGQVQGHKHDKE